MIDLGFYLPFSVNLILHSTKRAGLCQQELGWKKCYFLEGQEHDVFVKTILTTDK